MEQRELVGVPGVPESALTAEMLGRLPESAPPAPWEGTASVLMWLSRGGRAATQALPPKLRSEVSARGVVGGMVHYRETPVGTYNEVFGNVAFRRGAQPRSTVAFMAVDLPASLVGGRSNWALPKTLATFDGEPAATRTLTAVGRGWKVGARVASLGPAIPLRNSMRLEQEWPDGIVRPCTMRVRGRGRLALVTVDVEAPGSLSGWLKSGRHLGMVFETVHFAMSPPGEPGTT